MQNEQQIKYIIYCRKSSEQEDRQVLSIESQRNELLDVAKREHLKVVEILEESHSAKKLDRPIFAALIEKFPTFAVLSSGLNTNPVYYL